MLRIDGIILNKIIKRITFKDPLVEPEHPPTIMITNINILRKFGHALKSSVTKPDVVLMETTLNAALRNDSSRDRSGLEEERPQVASATPMMTIDP